MPIYHISRIGEAMVYIEYLNLSDPVAELPSYCNKTRIFLVSKFSHTHMVIMNANSWVARYYCRLYWDNL